MSEIIAKDLPDFIRQCQAMTPDEMIRSWGEHTVSEFMTKMAVAKATVSFEFNERGFLIAKTDYGKYFFALDPNGSQFSIYQVL